MADVLPDPPYIAGQTGHLADHGTIAEALKLVTPALVAADIVLVTDGTLQDLAGLSKVCPLSERPQLILLYAAGVKHTVTQSISILIVNTADVVVGAKVVDLTADKAAPFVTFAYIPADTAATTYRAAVFAGNNGTLTVLADPTFKAFLLPFAL